MTALGLSALVGGRLIVEDLSSFAYMPESSRQKPVRRPL
jgi:hypothetical protein